MSNIDKFNETVSILVKAYMNDTLKHQDCTACVVGNLCEGNPIWKYLFMTYEGIQSQYDLTDDVITAIHLRVNSVKSINELYEKAINICKRTGYTVDQLAKIEYTFETVGGLGDDERMFNGLMAVVDVLAEIHSIDLTVKENAKLLFVKL